MAVKKYSHNRMIIGTTAELAALTPANYPDHFFFDSETEQVKYCDGVALTAVSAAPNTWLAKTEAYTLKQEDYGILADATGGAFVVTLPVAGDTPLGKEYEIIKTAGIEANTVTLDGDGAETVNGAANKVMKAQYDHIRVVNDGTGWLILDALLTP